MALPAANITLPTLGCRQHPNPVIFTSRRGFGLWRVTARPGAENRRTFFSRSRSQKPAFRSSRSCSSVLAGFWGGGGWPGGGRAGGTPEMFAVVSDSCHSEITRHFGLTSARRGHKQRLHRARAASDAALHPVAVTTNCSPTGGGTPQRARCTAAAKPSGMDGAICGGACDMQVMALGAGALPQARLVRNMAINTSADQIDGNVVHDPTAACTSVLH